MSLLNWLQTPRAFGSPYQTILFSEEELVKAIQLHSGKTPVFISHNPFGRVSEGKPMTIRLDKLFGDLDSIKPENALFDTRKLAKWSDDNFLPWICAYSGEKGFHFYILFKPEELYYDFHLETVYRNALRFLKEKLDLRTLCFTGSSPKRLCRVWYTPHITDDGVWNGRYCFPLLPEQLELTISEIEILATKPPDQYYDILQRKKVKMLTFWEFVEEFNISTEILEPTEQICSKSKIVSFSGVTDEFVKKLFHGRPCLKAAISSQNPSHKARFSVCVFLKNLGYSAEWIFQFFENQNYIDKHRIDKCAYQINHIFSHSPAYRMPTCQTLIDNNLCVGKQCPKYRE